MNKRLVLLLIIALLALSGCASAASNSNRYASPQTAAGAPAPAMDMDMGEYERPAAEPAYPEEQIKGEFGGGSVPAERLVIRNANLAIVVDDPAQAMTTVSRMAENMGGYVVSSNLFKSVARNGREVPEVNITVRVPSPRLNEAMDQIKGLVRDPGKDVLNESVSGQDVTKEYTDLRSRLKNLEQAEAQLRDIMADAKKTEDVLSVSQQLTYIREQIEVIKGQIQYFEEAAALSSIAIRIQAQDAVMPLEIAGWAPAGVARDALQALINTMQFAASAGIWLALYVLPVLVAIFLPLRLGWALFRRYNKPVKAQAPTPPSSAA
jgi:hypothetical protein